MKPIPPGNQAWRRVVGAPRGNSRRGPTSPAVRVIGVVVLIALSVFTVLAYFASTSGGRKNKPVSMVAHVRAEVEPEDVWFDPTPSASSGVGNAQPTSDPKKLPLDSIGGVGSPVGHASDRITQPSAPGFSYLRFQPNGCASHNLATLGDAGPTGAVVVEFLRVAPSGTPLGSQLADRHRPGGSHIVSFRPSLSDAGARYFPSEVLLDDLSLRRANITLLSDSMRVVAAPVLAASSSAVGAAEAADGMDRGTTASTDHAAGDDVGGTGRRLLSVDTRVVCDADDHDKPSRYSWAYDVGGAKGSAVVGVSFSEGDHHHVDATITFPRKSRTTLFGPASRGAGIRLRAGRVIPLRNLDVNHYRLDDDANLYGSVPLVYAVDLAHEHKYTFGLLWLNAAAMRIQVGRENDDGGITSVTFASEAGAGQLYVLPGPTAADVLVQYFSLTGAPQLPPLFSLGYHQCRWSYRDQADVIAVNDKFTEHSIPMDAIWLDIDHTNDKRYFTWDGRKFPDSKAMIRHLVESGRKLVTITDPHIKVDSNYFVYRGAHENHLFVTKSKSNHDEFHGHCWPGQSAWIDFANPKARMWYARLFDVGSDAYQGSTLDVFSWNDMNEPSVFSGPDITMPMEAGQTDGTNWYEHRELHNMYGFHQTQATFAGHLFRSNSHHRPFILTRSFFAGSQRYAAVWTGDNQANWQHLRGSVAMLQMHSMSGIVFIGADVGGFFDDPSEELHVRWFQLGCLYPFFRGHSHEQTRRREPWLYSAPVHRNIADAIRLRYTLLPYLYLSFYEAHRFGKPIWRPRVFEFPDEEEGAYLHVDEEESFLVGGALLAIPALHPGQTTTTVTIPSGSAYYNWWNGEVYPSSTKVHFPLTPATEDTRGKPVVPLCLRAGLGIPTLENADKMLSSSRSSLVGGSADAANSIALVFALDATCAAQAYLYHDDGFTTDFALQRRFCTRSAVASMIGNTALSINVTTSLQQVGAATTNHGAATPDMQRLVGVCDGRSATGGALLKDLLTKATNPFRFMNVKRVRIFTALCTRIPEGVAFTPQVTLRSFRAAHRIDNSELDARVAKSWFVKQVAEHVFEAEGDSINDAAWEMTMSLPS